MSVTWLPRQLGMVLRCGGVETRPNCKARLQTGQIQAACIRAYAATIDWTRGLRPGRKRRDLCPECSPIEKKLFAEWKAAREERKKQLDEKRKAKWAAKAEGVEAKPKKPRKKKSTAVSAGAVTAAEEASIGRPSSPSAASAPAPAT